MADYAKAADAIIAAIEKKATELQGETWGASHAAPLLLQLAQAYAAVRDAGK